MNAEQPTFEGFEQYRSHLVDAAREQGLESARRGDPEGFDLALWAIRRLALEDETFTADDVRGLAHVGSNAVGSAFRFLRLEGEIDAVGFTTSRVPSRHGAAIRVWKGSS